jgi:diguanylate cyclase (GGDEF)-like protein
MVLSRLTAAGEAFGVMHVDLDFFKEVNDSFGHAAGDHVLQRVAEVLVHETRKTDTVARVGGDEFTIVLPEVRNADLMARIGARIIARLEQPIPFNGHNCQISASIGAVWVETGAQRQMAEILADADLALYASKHGGRSRLTLYSPEMRRKTRPNLAPGRRRGARSLRK